MLPAERGEVSKELVWDVLGPAQSGNGALRSETVVLTIGNYCDTIETIPSE
jgi:hypothetical protein